MAFLEGIVTFISPCLLPMIPIYVTYFAGGGERTTLKTLKNALGFVLGFTVVFVLLGTLAGVLGGFLVKYRVAVNIVTGLVVVFFGLSYLGVFKLNIFNGIGKNSKTENLGFFSSVIFGIIFSLGWTPCVGTFLGSALLLASQQQTVVAGTAMLLLYSLGLGIPFVVSALLIDKLKTTFDYIKKNYGIINKVCGVLLIVIGILMMTGLTGTIVNILS
ncbi:MAG: cytochrome c biogenesis protein CcdA [Clostridia bacterium]|nr:cytochrome c biogenesis protein CcdA [Clostridia bacterium]